MLEMVGILNEQECRDFLAEHCFAHLGCHSGDRLYVVPISYVLDGNRMIGQTKAGMKIDIMRENPKVCVQVDQIENIANWNSVIAWGQFEELSGHEAIEAMGKLIDWLGNQIEDLGSSRSPRDVTPKRVDNQPQVDILYGIHITEITGRFERP